MRDAAEYLRAVGRSYNVTMGEDGGLALPLELRTRAGLTRGTKLVAFGTDDGVVLMTRKQLLRRVRDDFDGLQLVNELLAERREAAKSD